jgi:hypothetical protein
MMAATGFYKNDPKYPDEHADKGYDSGFLTA